MRRIIVVGLGTCCFVVIPWPAEAIAVGPEGREFIDKALEVLDNPRWHENDPFLAQEPIGGRMPEQRPSYERSAIEGRELSCILGVMAESWRSPELLEQIEKYTRHHNRKVAIQSTAHLVDVGKWSLGAAQAFAAEQKWSRDEIRQIGRLLASKPGRQSLAEAKLEIGKARYLIRLQTFKIVGGAADTTTYRHDVLLANDAEPTGAPSYELIAILPEPASPAATKPGPPTHFGAITACASDGTVYVALGRSVEQLFSFHVWAVQVGEDGSTRIRNDMQRPLAETVRPWGLGVTGPIEFSASCTKSEIVLTGRASATSSEVWVLTLDLGSKEWREGEIVP